MKNKTKLIIILSCALTATLAVGLTACAGSDTRESTLDRFVKEGRDVIVHYDRNGGVFNSTENVDLFDAYRSKDVKEGGVKLVAPGDAARDGGKVGGNNAIGSTATRSGYTLIGWYRSMEPRTDAAGNPLDDEGNLCYRKQAIVDENGEPVLDEEGNATYEILSDAGKPQGYMYSGRWDFEKDRLTEEDLEPETYGKRGEVLSFSLYAAWAPNYIYEFYRPTSEGGWEVYGSVTKPVSLDAIAVPHWDETRGSLNYESVPRYSVAEDKNSGTEAKSYTLTGIYADPDCTQPYAADRVEGDCTLRLFEGEIPHHGTTDPESGTATGTTVRLYTTWKEGNWFRITTGRQLTENASPDGCYLILADLNCANTTWTFSGFTFTGTFEGNGHTVSNIVSRQTDATSKEPQRVYGGLFGTFTADAQLNDIRFENVSFTVAAGARRVTAGRDPGSFGLFAGEIGKEVTAENFKNVSVSGTIYVGGRDLVPVSGAKANERITSFTVGAFAGNLFGESLLSLGVTLDIAAEAAVHDYDQDLYGNSIYGTTLLVSLDDDEDSEDYGLVSVSVLPEPQPVSTDE